MTNLVKAIFNPHLVISILALLISTMLHAQTSNDSVIANFNIFDRLKTSTNGSEITIEPSSQIENLLKQHFDKGGPEKNKGWRVRIFRDNSQNGRARSEALKSTFNQNNPGVPVYRTYESPYWYVAIGDFRTRDEAEKMKKELKSTYPGASLIEVFINFPPL